MTALQRAFLDLYSADDRITELRKEIDTKRSQMKRIESAAAQVGKKLQLLEEIIQLRDPDSVVPAAIERQRVKTLPDKLNGRHNKLEREIGALEQEMYCLVSLNKWASSGS